MDRFNTSLMLRKCDEGQEVSSPVRYRKGWGGCVGLVGRRLLEGEGERSVFMGSYIYCTGWEDGARFAKKGGI